MRLEGSGHSYAVNRAMSTFSPGSHFQEQIKGIVYLNFLEKLEEDFRKNPKALGEKLSALSKKFFSGERLLLAVGGDTGIFEKEKEELSSFLERRFPEKEDWRERAQGGLQYHFSGELCGFRRLLPRGGLPLYRKPEGLKGDFVLRLPLEEYSRAGKCLWGYVRLWPKRRKLYGFLQGSPCAENLGAIS